MKNAPEAPTGSVLNGLYLDLLSGINSGEFPANTTLPTEGSLARDYGVSRSVVRAALQMLKRHGIVKSQQGSGTIVTCDDLQKAILPNFDEQLPNLIDCYACRLAIEPEIAAQLATWRSDTATAYLEAQLRDIDQRANGAPSADNLWAARDADFHVRLATYSENRFFSSIIAELRPYILFSMNTRKFMNETKQNDHFLQSEQEHKGVIYAILDGDPNTARTSMRQHISNARGRLFSNDQKAAENLPRSA